MHLLCEERGYALVNRVYLGVSSKLTHVVHDLELFVLMHLDVKTKASCNRTLETNPSTKTL
jgi:hypothetical protein